MKPLRKYKRRAKKIDTILKNEVKTHRFKSPLNDYTTTTTLSKYKASVGRKKKTFFSNDKCACA